MWKKVTDALKWFFSQWWVWIPLSVMGLLLLRRFFGLWWVYNEPYTAVANLFDFWPFNFKMMWLSYILYDFVQNIKHMVNDMGRIP